MIRLRPWQEVRGPFRSLRHEAGHQILTLDGVGDIEVEEVTIDAEAGDVVAVLRTDGDYRVREGGR